MRSLTAVALGLVFLAACAPVGQTMVAPAPPKGGGADGYFKAMQNWVGGT